MMRKLTLLTIGTALVDVLANASDEFLGKHNLEKGATNFVSRPQLEKIQKQIEGSVVARLPGDNSRNTCEGVRFLGGTAAYASTVADDDDGMFFEESLKKTGVADLLEKKQGRTGKIIALMSPDGERTFAADLGVSVDYEGDAPELAGDAFFAHATSITLLSKGSVSTSARRLLQKAREKKTNVSISLESPPMIRENREELFEELERGCDVLFANEDELEALTGGRSINDAKKLSGLVKVFFLKKGKFGSVVFDRGSVEEVPALAAKLVDSTGAGDYYAAGALWALSNGVNGLAAAQQGTTLATRIVQRVGASLI